MRFRTSNKAADHMELTLLDYSHLSYEVFFDPQNFYLGGWREDYHNTAISSDFLRFQSQENNSKRNSLFSVY